MNRSIRCSTFVETLALLLAFATQTQAQDRDFTNERSTRHFTRERTYDVQHLTLELSFDPPQGIVIGRATTKLSPLNDGLERIVFDAVDLDIESISLQDGSPLSFNTTDKKLLVDLDRPYDSGESITLTVVYRAQPRMGLYFVRPDTGYPNKPWQIWSQGEMEASRYWFPCYDFPNDQMTSEMIITVPKDQMAISNGALVKVNLNEQEETVTYHWKENVPHVTYLVSLAVGKFAEVRTEWDGIPILYYVDPRDRDKVKRSFSKTPDMMRFFSEKIGVRYPYEKYSQVTITDFMYGGMENVSATTLTARTLHDKRAHQDVQSDGLVAHELAHQWWGNLLTTKNWNHIWLNEAFATYFADLYVEHDEGLNEFIMEMEDNRRAYLTEDSTKYRRPIVTDRYENPAQMFDRHTFRKGAWVLHMIRYLLGDELWWKAIHHYASTHAEQTVETNDFKQAIEDATGKPLEWFFDQWIFRGGHPIYEVSWKWDEEGSAVLLEVKQTQQVNEVTPLFRMPIEIHVSGAFGTETYRVEVDDAKETFFFSLPSKPDRVDFDPHDWVLKELKFKKEKKELLNQLEYAEGIVGRLQAAEGLVEHPDDPKVVKALGKTLREDPFWGVRGRAAETLGKIKTQAARDVLFAGLKDPESRVRRKVIMALGKFKEDEVVAKPLEKTFQKDSSYFAQAEAVRSLARIRALNAFQICVKALEQDSHNEVIRSAAFDGFIELRDSLGINYALHWAAYGKPTQVRTSAIAALGRLAEYGEGRQDELLDQLITYLDDPHFRARTAAMKALGDLGDPQAIAALERSILREPHFRRNETARKAIRKIRENQKMETRLTSLKTDLEEIQEENRLLRKRLDSLESRIGITGESGTFEAKGAGGP